MSNSGGVDEADILAQPALTTGGTAGAYLPQLDLIVNPTPVHIFAGANFTGTIVSFAGTNTTSNPGHDISLINWGDGTTSAGIVSAIGGNQLSISGSHDYAKPGSYSMFVTITSATGEIGISQSTVTVADNTGPTVKLTDDSFIRNPATGEIDLYIGGQRHALSQEIDVALGYPSVVNLSVAQFNGITQGADYIPNGWYIRNPTTGEIDLYTRGAI